MNKITYFKRVVKVNYFSTTNSCQTSPVSNDNNLPSEDNNLQDEGNSNNDSSSNQSHETDSNQGYETDSNRSFFEEGANAMADYPVREIPEDQIRRYIRDTAEINRHPEEAGVDGPDDGEWRQHWIDRNQDLRDELRRRKNEGIIPDSESEYYETTDESQNEYGAASGDTHSDANSNSDAGAGAGPNADAGAGPSTDPDSGAYPDVSSSSTNKRKLEEDSESTQPSKSFKQDSSDVTGATEPFDFCGGDD